MDTKKILKSIANFSFFSLFLIYSCIPPNSPNTNDSNSFNLKAEVCSFIPRNDWVKLNVNSVSGSIRYPDGSAHSLVGHTRTLHIKNEGNIIRLDYYRYSSGAGPEEYLNAIFKLPSTTLIVGKTYEIDIVGTWHWDYYIIGKGDYNMTGKGTIFVSETGDLDISLPMVKGDCIVSSSDTSKGCGYRPTAEIQNGEIKATIPVDEFNNNKSCEDDGGGGSGTGDSFCFKKLNTLVDPPEEIDLCYSCEEGQQLITEDNRFIGCSGGDSIETEDRKEPFGTKGMNRQWNNVTSCKS